MIATDLMIGDWVMAEYRDQDNRPARISALTDSGGINLHFQNGMCLGTNLNCNHIKPIPLTPKILKENGFVFESNVGYKFEDYTGGIVICDVGSQDITVLYNYKVIFSCDYTGFCVHSLQHVLRLCMIDKEITL